MKDGLLGIGVSILVVGWLVIFQRSVDANHPGWVFFVEVISTLIGLASIQKIGKDGKPGSEETKT